MSIHFAGSRRPAISPLARCLTMPRAMQAVNDNYGAGTADALIDNPLLRSALEHFARHGLSAAGAARTHAEDAFLAGDGETYRHWLGVCRLLDRRLAARGAAPAQAGVSQLR